MNRTAKPKLLIITGPTGAGKTSLSLQVAQALKGHIINADSLAFYRGLDIGAAKPTPAERALAPHHLFDVVEPHEEYNAASYLKAARPLIAGLWAKGRPPLVVGGTGLYLRSLAHGLFAGPGRDEALRAAIKALASEKGPEYLHRQLGAVDPVTAARLAPKDLVRIERALEVYQLTGKPISAWQSEHRLKDDPFDYLAVIVNRPKPELEALIEKRTRAMLAGGLLAEVEALLKAGVPPRAKPLQAIGYKEAQAFLNGEISLTETSELINRATKRLAKRQLTWLRGQLKGVWLNNPSAGQIVALAEKHFGLTTT